MHNHESIAAHCREIDRCNQRGGRMLSMVDLLCAQTVDLDMAGYLASAISRGASFLVGALPGGAGKTTIMGALLNFVPPGCRLVAADSGATVRDARASTGGRLRLCYICHEIGAGPYYAYLWGRDARDFFALPSAGHMIATNLHADTFEQCHDQLCYENDVREGDFQRCNLCLFVHRVGRSWTDQRRRIVAVYESDGKSPHQLVWHWNDRCDSFEQVAPSALVGEDDKQHMAMRDLIADMDACDQKTTVDVRQRFVEEAGRHLNEA